jgi:hypothetical protein
MFQGKVANRELSVKLMLNLDELRLVGATSTTIRGCGVFGIYSFIKDNYAVFQFQFSEGCDKTSIEQAVYFTICLKYTGGPLIERRRANRFQVDWEIRVERVEGSDRKLVDTGKLRNLSSTGALLCLPGPLETGSQVDVHIKLPLDGNKWIRYSARVVRTDLSPAAVTAAVSFDSARPDFGTPVVPRQN